MKRKIKKILRVISGSICVVFAGALIIMGVLDIITNIAKLGLIELLVILIIAVACFIFFDWIWSD